MGEESKIPQDVWKEWLSMKPTEEFVQIIENRISDSMGHVSSVVLGTEDKEAAWSQICAMRGVYGNLAGLLADMRELGGIEDET